MDLFKAIKSRKSIRNFQSKEIEQEKLQKILSAAIQAPSAGNLQPWEFIIVKDKKQKEKIADAAPGQDFVSEAPVIVVVCANEQRSASKYGERGKNLYSIQDCANATVCLMLAAHSLGLGTVWVGAFSEQELKKILNLPQNIRPLAIIPIGYPNESPEKPERIPLDKVIHKEKF